MLFITKIIILIIIYLLFSGYFRIKYPFWSIQPVFHFHNLFYWIYPRGIINHNLPKEHKTFYDYTMIFDKLENVNEIKINDFVYLIQSQYLRSKEIDYIPSKKNILSYLKNLDKPTYIGLKYNKQYIKGIAHDKLIGCITGKPLTCNIGSTEFIVNYVDYLCVHKKHRKSGLAPKLIHTYYVNQRRKSNHPVFLFKRESANTMIVPLCTYISYAFSLQYFTETPELYSQLLTSKQLYNYIYDVSQIKQDFKCSIITPLTNLETLVDNKIVLIYGIIDNLNTHALYFFKYTETKIDNNMVVECFASYKRPLLSDKKFYIGFLNALYDLKKNHHIKTIIIENIAHNHMLISKFIKKNTPLFRSYSSYYFYNFAYRPFLPKDVLMIH
tara:strand:- start:8511 stop:9662 length:1152 start_codon:yes stop_codon:yes gene_type:complete